MEKRITSAIKSNRVVGLLGPRQCGKTTIANIVSEKSKSQYFDLENPKHNAQLSEPMIRLESMKGLIILDEIQRQPELFEIIRVLVDKTGFKGKFLLLGSASPKVIKNASESLAGRISFIDMSGFNMNETGINSINKLWVRGGFPKSYLARSNAGSNDWRQNFIRTFLERDIPQLGISIPSATLYRFWTMLAHYHGQIWNAAEFARSLGTSEATARRYLNILSGTYVVRQLSPWYENLKKRQIKAPKIYIRDTGILHTLLSLDSEKSLISHPKVGASWEGFVIEQFNELSTGTRIYYWGTHAGAELDLLYLKKGKRIGIEIKYQDAPVITKSMHIAIEDLKLSKLYVVYPGQDRYSLSKKILAIPLTQLPELF